MTPQACYQRDLQQKGFSQDPAQAEAVRHLQQLYEALCHKPSLLQRLFNRRPKPVRGLYFWGGVGRGKTWLMDTFYHCLPFAQKRRMHFHHFMRWVHEELTALAGQKNPLTTVAECLAKEARVICFDEFFVTDITDAMILGGLLEQLFRCGVTLVTTSNVPPGQLYSNGLQRARFLPAIGLIEQNTHVVNVDGGIDYRLRLLEKAATYHWPLNDENRARLEGIFADLADPVSMVSGQPMEIAGRSINSVKHSDGVAWFTFADLCDGPRSQNDYIEIAYLFHSVIVQDLPQFDASRNDQARRFIALVDEIYDQGVKLIISSEVPPEALYPSGTLHFEFQRTISRLQEMQSTDYLARAHNR